MSTVLPSPGPTSTNTRTTTIVRRYPWTLNRHECVPGTSSSDKNDDENRPPHRREKPTTYLQPGAPWPATHTLGPDVTHQPRVFMGPEEAFWPGTEGLRDGEVDEQGWAEEAGSGVGVFEVGRWVFKEELLVVMVEEARVEFRDVPDETAGVRQ